MLSEELFIPMNYY